MHDSMPDRRGAGPEGAPLRLVTLLAVTFALTMAASFGSVTFPRMAAVTC